MFESCLTADQSLHGEGMNVRKVSGERVSDAVQPSNKQFSWRELMPSSTERRWVKHDRHLMQLWGALTLRGYSIS